jgi:hypothetical protein
LESAECRDPAKWQSRAVSITWSLIPADGHGVEMLLQGTDDDKHDKNRLHLDLRTADLEREIERIVGLARPCSPITR